MSTLNHDTELEEILLHYRSMVAELVQDRHSHGITTEQLRVADDQAKSALNTYLYKQTLELIGPDKEPEYGVAKLGNQAQITGNISAVYNSIKEELRKAAAERGGQE